MKHFFPRSRDVRRLGALVFVPLQFTVFAAVPVADAVLEARGLGTVTHIEGEDSEHCDTGHSHLLCQVTRTLSSGVSAPVSIDFRLASEAGFPTSAATAWENRPIPPGGSGPRAPPPQA